MHQRARLTLDFFFYTNSRARRKGRGIGCAVVGRGQRDGGGGLCWEAVEWLHCTVNNRCFIRVTRTVWVGGGCLKKTEGQVNKVDTRHKRESEIQFWRRQ